MDEALKTRSPSFEIEQAKLIGSRYRGPNRVVFVVNNEWWFLSHRATWGAALRAAGAEVTIIAADTGKADLVRNLGFNFIALPLARESSSSLNMGLSALRILATLLKLRPNVVFLTAQAAYTLGWPAAVFLRQTRFVRVVSGAGRALDPAVLNTTASRIVQISGRLAGRLTNVFTLFQVPHDRETFIRLGMLPCIERSLVIPGTGIDLQAWQSQTERDFTKPIVLFASRLFREKGIYEFVEAAGRLRDRGWRFQVAGDPDHGVESAVKPEELARLREDGAVELLGHRTDMPDILSKATLFVLPTRHPEGTPKALIEAGASGLPCVVSGHPGCKAVVDDGSTGIVLNAEPTITDLTSAIELLASDPDLARSMGDAARRRISCTFSLDLVLTRLLEWAPVGSVRS